MEFTVGSRAIEIKFDYMLMFKVVNYQVATTTDNQTRTAWALYSFALWSVTIRR